MIKIPEPLRTEYAEVCKRCGCTKGSHHGGTNPWPYDYCPGHEDRMAWDKGPGTTFNPSGEYRYDD